LWVRVTLTVNNGASGNDSNFYTSTDGTTWTQLGTTVTTAGVTSIFASTSIVEVGSVNAGALGPVSGRVYRAQVLNGINGTTVLDVDCDAITSGSATSFTATTGQTVTINRATSGRKSVAVPSRSKGGRPLMLLGTDDYLECVDAAQHGALNFGSPDSFTVLVAMRQWATPPNGRPFISKANYNTNGGWRLMNNATALSGRLFGNQGNVGPISPTFTAGSMVTLVGVRNRITQTATCWSNGVAGATETSNPQAMDLRIPGRLRVGSNSEGSEIFNEFELFASAIFRRALSAREITVIANQTPWGT
jgi:hypothetical protein